MQGTRAGDTDHLTCSRSACCSSSWSWRPSTRAGPCRWRSSWSCRCACSPRSRRADPAQDVNIFGQIGFVVLVGLAAKNAILIVEFARDRARASAARGTVEACRAAAAADPDDVVRVHPRRLPLVVATGAGPEMRRSLGRGVQRHARGDAVRLSSRRCSTRSCANLADRQERQEAACRRPAIIHRTSSRCLGPVPQSQYYWLI